MAEFFKKLGERVSNVADKTKVKAKGIYDVTKLKLELNKKEVDLDECFEKLGRAYFVQVKNKIDNSEKIETLTIKAENLSNEIFNLKKNIADAQNKKVCDHCASIIDTDAPYCSNCGQKVVAEKKSENNNSTEEKSE